MVLFSRFKDIFSKGYWQKAKFHTLSSSMGFFAFWMVMLSLIISICGVVFVNMLVNHGVDEFRKDFVDFEVKMEDGVLSTQNIPDPFVFSEFMNSDDSSSIFGLEGEMLAEFKAGFKEGLSEEMIVDGQKIDADDIEFVLDTTNKLGVSVDTVDMEKVGFYFLSDQIIVTNPTAKIESELISVETYENTEDFLFDKEYVISIWESNSTKALVLFFVILLSVSLLWFVVARFVTALWWAFVLWAIASLLNFKFDYFEAYGMALVYLVPITLIELVVLFLLGWIPFLTIGLMIIFGFMHGAMGNSKMEDVKPEVLEKK